MEVEENAKKYLITVGMIIILLVVFFTFLNFADDMQHLEVQKTQITLAELSRHNCQAITMQLNKAAVNLKNTGISLSFLQSINSPEALALTQQILANTTFDRMGIATTDGMSTLTTGEALDISDRWYFQASLRGESIITSTTMQLLDEPNDEVFMILEPIYWENEIIGVIYGVYLINNFADVLNFPTFNGEGYVHVFEKNGEFIYKSQHDNAHIIGNNIFEDLAQGTLDQGYTLADIQHNIDQGQSGYLAYSLDDGSRYAYYEPLGINDWYVLIAIPKTVVEQNAYLVQVATFFLSLKIFLIFVLFMIAMMLLTRRSQQKILRAHDILKISEERFRIAASQTANTIFDYDLLSKTLYYNGDQMHKYGLINPCLSNVPESLIERGIVASESIQDCREVFQAIQDGAEKATCILKVHLADGNAIYERMTLTNLFDDHGVASRAIGTSEDITAQHKREIVLTRRAERDHLTGLFNRAGFQQQLDRLADPNGHHAFLLIDMDNFKTINDTWGHLAGDDVLVDIAKTLSESVRDGDIVARLGGDEFVILLKNMASISEVARRAEAICNNLHKCYKRDDQTVTVSSTIGIAFVPNDGKVFEELYECSDLALYYAKQQGKDRCMVYDETMKK